MANIVPSGGRIENVNAFAGATGQDLYAAVATTAIPATNATIAHIVPLALRSLKVGP